VHALAFAHAAELLTKASQVPESLGDGSSKPECKPITGVPTVPGVEHEKRKTKTRTRRTNRSQISLEENYHEVANA
jgi:hypothetical protein